MKRIKKDDGGHYECLVYAPNGNLRFHRRVTIVVLKRNNEISVSSTTPGWYDDEEEEDIQDRKIACTYDQSSRNKGIVGSSVSFDAGDDLEGRVINDLENEKYNETETSVEMPEVDEPYLCFDLQDKKRKMTHYLVKSAGTTATLYCNPMGKPYYQVTWLKEDRPFQTTGYQHKISKNALVLKDISKFDEAIYTCQITNGVQTLNYSIKFVVTSKCTIVF